MSFNKALENIVPKGEMLVTSIFPFSHKIFFSFKDQFSHLTHSHTTTPFDTLGNKPFENAVGKGESACNEQFLLYPQCFLPV